MKPLYVCSVRPNSGKSLINISIAKKFAARMKVGIYKPIGTLPTKVKNVWTEQDMVLANEILGLDIPVSKLCSVLMTPDLTNRAYKGKFIDKLPIIKKDFKYNKDRCDFLILEGSQDIFIGAMIGLPAYKLVKILKTKMVIVNRFESDNDAESILAVKNFLGKDFIGVIFNNVQRSKLAYVERLVVPMLRRNDVEVFGVIPKDKIMSSVTAGEVADILGGEVLNSHDFLDNMADRIMVGAMNLEKSYEYFKKTKNKIVIVGGDRADIQLAALETDTAAVVLTGGLYPNDIILGKADEMDIPLIRAKGDTFKVVDQLEGAMEMLRLDNKMKVDHGINLVQRKLDFDLLESHLK